MPVWFKQGLLRVIVFVIVGIAVVISTQVVRGQDPKEVTIQIRQLVRGTISSWMGEPGSRGAPETGEPDSSGAPEASLKTPGANPKSVASIVEVAVSPPKTLSLASAQVAASNINLPTYCEQSAVAAGSIVMGDKIQLRFFAAIRIPAVGTGSLSTAAIDSMAYERLDLSGTYEIGEDGTAAVPLIGRIDLVGRSLACAETLVASRIAAQDGSISTVTASFAMRLPLTVSGAVRAPGTYTHSPGMTVNRLLNLAGASFGDGPFTLQELESLIAQRDELAHRQVLAALELGRLKSNIAGNNEIVINDGFVANVPTTVFAALIDAESAALQQDLSVSRISDERNAVAVAGLVQKLKSTSSQLASVTTQLSSLQIRHDEMSSLKSRGIIQASQLDIVLSNLMELSRIKMQLETDQSNMHSQIELAKEEARLAIQMRLQDFSRRAAALSGEISLFEVQLSAIRSRLVSQGIGTDGTELALPLRVTVLRTGVDGENRLNATLDTVVLPGDMVTVLLATDAPPISLTEMQATADNNHADDAGANAPGRP